jgi:ABC-2 type transport system ATP-binding protein
VALSFEQVSFHYRSVWFRRPGDWVFRDFSWRLPTGKTVLLGPNGAGKTTLLSLGVGAMRPTAGAIHPDGVRQESGLGPLRRAAAMMPQRIVAIPGFTAREQVAYAAWLRGADPGLAALAASSALERVGLEDHAASLVSTLSGGQLRRVGLAQALVLPSRVLLLDEPTAGLDPAQRSTFRALVAALPEEETVLVSTHQVDDLSEVYDTVVVLARGEIRFQGSPSDFLAAAPAGSARPAEAAYIQILGSEA